MMRTFLAALRGLFCQPTAAQRRKEGITMNAAYEKLIQHLDEHEIRYLTSSDNRSICADFRGEVGTYRIVAAIDPDDSLFQVFGNSPVYVPEGCRRAIGEAVVRANYGLKVGKFEMDFGTGDLRFQASQLLPYDTLEDQTIERLIGTAMAMLNMYLPAILSVIYGNELPKDAVACVEAGRRGASETDRGEAAQ